MSFQSRLASFIAATGADVKALWAAVNGKASLVGGYIPDSQLPLRIGPRGNVNNFGGDWNNAVSPGTYSGNNAANAPGAGWWLVDVETHDNTPGNQWVTQTAHGFAEGDGPSDTKLYRRSGNAGTPTAWTAWYRCRIAEEEQVANHNVKRHTYTSLPGARPAVPAGVYIEWVGPQNPSALMINYDTWVPTV